MLHILHCIYSILQTGCLNTRNSYLIFLTTGTILTRTAEFSHRKLYSVTCSTFWADLQIKNKHWLLTKQNILDEASKYPYHDFFFLFLTKTYHCTSSKDSFSQNHKTVAAKTKILSLGYAILEKNNNLPLTIMCRVKTTCILNTKKHKCNKLKNPNVTYP